MKKSVFALAVVSMLTMALAGCSSPKGKEAGTESGTESRVESGVQEAATEKGDDQEEIHLTFQYIGGTVPAQDKVITDAIAAFEEENPGITVEPIYIDWANGHSQFYNAVMAGTAPDMTMLGGTWCVEFLEMGVFAPITDYVSQDLMDKFIPAGFDIMTGPDGTVYGLPWDGCTWGVIYRTDLFEQPGIESVPKTWD